MLVITVRHATTYRYKQPVAFGEHRMMLRPRDSYDQKLLDAKLAITPEPADIRWVHDVFGNCVAIARFAGRAQELDIESVIRLDHSPTNALDFEIEEYAKRYPFTYGADEMPDLLRSIERQYLDPEREVDRWARQFLRHDGRTDTSELLAAMTFSIRAADFSPCPIWGSIGSSCFASTRQAGNWRRTIRRSSPRANAPARGTSRFIRRCRSRMWSMS